MKPLRIIAATLLLAAFTGPALAQQQTLIGGDVEFGGYGGPVLRVSPVNGKTALFVGGRGGMLLGFTGGHALSIGGGGYGLATNVAAKGITEDGRPLDLELGYGGFEIEYINRSDRLIHFSIPIHIGAGGVTYRKRGDTTRDYDEDSFFAFEPGATVELNVASFMRVGAGVSYRYVSGSDLPGAADADLSGVAGSFTLKFGSF